MISAVAYDGYVEATIIWEDKDQFEMELMKIKNSIARKDREYKTHKRVWVIRHPENYINIPFIRIALLDRKQQMTLF